MTGIYYTDVDAVLRAAGLVVRDDSYNAGWQTRARSSGGFPAPPLAVWWHHTASNTSIGNDLAWQCDGCDDAPVGNMTIDRDGTVWPVAAGASNCAGKGGPATFSRGTVPADSGNTRGWQIEVCNDGVGERWPVAQINAYFTASNALNALFGNRADDVITHNVWAPTRKIDPARADVVEGSWQPRPSTSSGTWHPDDIKAECLARAGSPAPGPLPPIGDDMVTVIKGDGSDSYYAWNGVALAGIPSLNWVQTGFDLGVYANTDPVVCHQAEVDALLEAQGER